MPVEESLKRRRGNYVDKEDIPECFCFRRFAEVSHMIVECFRHKADRYCSILADGRVSLDDILAYLSEVHSVEVPMNDIFACVKFNNKRRLQLCRDADLGLIR